MGLLDFGAGWALGAKSGETHFDEVIQTGKDVLRSQEVADLVHALRSHVGYSLKALGGLVMGDETEPSNDLLDIVRNLVQRREGSGRAGSTPPLQEVVRDLFRDQAGGELNSFSLLEGVAHRGGWPHPPKADAAADRPNQPVG